MAKVPAKPKNVGGCTSIGGITLCPHLAHLTKEQIATVHKMHLQNVAKIKKQALRTAAKSAKGKRKTRKLAG